MNVRALRRIGLCALVVAVASCGSTAPVTLNGIWNGKDPNGGVFNLQLRQSGTVVGGYGASSQAGTSTITGTVDGSTFFLLINAVGFIQASYSGTFTATTMTGTIDGSGYHSDELVLTLTQ